MEYGEKNVQRRRGRIRNPMTASQRDIILFIYSFEKKTEKKQKYFKNIFELLLMVR